MIRGFYLAARFGGSFSFRVLVFRLLVLLATIPDLSQRGEALFTGKLGVIYPVCVRLMPRSRKRRLESQWVVPLLNASRQSLVAV